MGNNGAVAGVKLPANILDFMDKEIENGQFMSRSDWIRSACRAFYEIRKRDGAGGGGALIKLSAPAPARASAGGGAVALLSMI